MLRIILLVASVFFYSLLDAQSFPYSKNYFQWPVKTKVGIVANFGELRSDHWHMGLDIRTDQKENMPVFAAAEGYIAMISIEPFSYGKAIYINHPNGLTTVYGHLNKFFSGLDSLVKIQQYKKQSWEIELHFAKDQFPVTKGQFIAYSGSTGASQGPHVHFEIRNTETGKCINPLFFNLPVPDTVKPVFAKLAMYDRTQSIFEQDPILFTVKKTDSGYKVKDDTIRAGFSRLSFAINGYDRVTGSSNPNGIFAAKIFYDEQPVIEFIMDSMDYHETEYIHAHIDYRYRYNGGTILQYHHYFSLEMLPYPFIIQLLFASNPLWKYHLNKKIKQSLNGRIAEMLFFEKRPGKKPGLKRSSAILDPTRHLWILFPLQLMN